MKCPRDQVDLERSTYEAAIEIDRCERCGGVFLDRGELEVLQATVERDYRDELAAAPDLVGGAHSMALAAARPPVECPRCAVPMERREHGYSSQILIDVCSQCGGVWLDRGELEALEVFFERAQSSTADVRRGFLKSLLQLFEQTPRPPRD